jgi:hypothetical protein
MRLLIGPSLYYGRLVSRDMLRLYLMCFQLSVWLCMNMLVMLLNMQLDLVGRLPLMRMPNIETRLPYLVCRYYLLQLYLLLLLSLGVWRRYRV